MKKLGGKFQLFSSVLLKDCGPNDKSKSTHAQVNTSQFVFLLQINLNTNI